MRRGGARRIDARDAAKPWNRAGGLAFARALGEAEVLLGGDTIMQESPRLEAAAACRRVSVPGTRLLVAAATPEGLQCVAPLAAHLAGATGEVVVLHVDSPAASEGDEQHSWIRLVRWQRESLHLPVRLVSRHGREPCAAIAEIAREEDVGLVVVTPQRRAERRILLGSVTEKLVRQAELDILCVPFAAAKERDLALQRILVYAGAAGGPEPDLAWPVHLARQRGCGLHVLGVVPVDPWPGPFGLAGARETARAARQSEVAAWTRRRLPAGVPTVVSAVVGDPTTEILGRAHGIGADMIVLPPPSTDPDEAFIGSTTERVLRRSRWPVLISAAVREPAAAD